MRLIRKKLLELKCTVVVFSIALMLNSNYAFAKNLETNYIPYTIDTIVPNNGIPLPYPISDRRGDAFSTNKNNPLDLNNPSNYTDSVVYDSKTKRYIVYEKIGNKYYRTPTSYSFDEYWKMRNRQSENEYFKERSNTLSILNRGKVKPKLKIGDNLFNRLFGNGKI